MDISHTVKNDKYSTLEKISNTNPCQLLGDEDGDFK